MGIILLSFAPALSSVKSKAASQIRRLQANLYDLKTKFD
jgi:hypothetical protein